MSPPCPGAGRGTPPSLGPAPNNASIPGEDRILDCSRVQQYPTS
jgi:hypothetical protein